ncbi:MAG: L-histidine N(alpha)-methyltransferase [Thermoleophilia bacterium]
MQQLSTVSIDVHLHPGDLQRLLRDEVAHGLALSPKELSPKWLYDDAGCALFDEITRLPEYYPTRREREILERRAGEIAEVTRADTLVELGSGSGEKTLVLLDGLARAGTLARYAPFDVAELVVRDLAERTAERYPGLEVHGVVGDFTSQLDLVPTGGRRLIAFLGGTIGNLFPVERRAFLTTLAAGLAPGDAILVGTDLVKDVSRLEAAYDDAAGVTARFNLNLLAMLNRELDADFDLDGFEHVARFDQDEEWIEMRLRSRADQVVRVRALGLTAVFAAGEELRTEISAKFRREGVEAELAAAGLELDRWWTDAQGDFALWLATRA